MIIDAHRQRASAHSGLGPGALAVAVELRGLRGIYLAGALSAMATHDPE